MATLLPANQAAPSAAGRHHCCTVQHIHHIEANNGLTLHVHVLS